MPKTQIFVFGEDVSVVTSAAEERDFLDTFTEALKPFMANGSNAREHRDVVRAGFDIVAKLRGYKNGVQERRLLAAGRWPIPTDSPKAEGGTDVESAS